jgi:hypothetical protein
VSETLRALSPQLSHEGASPIRKILFATAAVLLPFAANAGCLTGAAVGGVAGHVAGHHGLLGAGAGCVIGHEHSKHEKEKAAQQTSAHNSAMQNNNGGNSSVGSAPTQQ